MKKIRTLASLSILLVLGGCSAAFGPSGGVPAYAFNFACFRAPVTLDSPPSTSTMPLPNGVSPKTQPAATVAAPNSPAK
ncbi:MAG: hypothetical protein K8R92_09290 [Planctomycetes bacterium]|nr:hypothetical protein [Planctomycetota bacterium]